MPKNDTHKCSLLILVFFYIFFTKSFKYKYIQLRNKINRTVFFNKQELIF